jgi:CYTH domain-containing protein
MENWIRTVNERKFLVRGLPEAVAPAEAHLQIFDNYLPGTDLRLRKERNPSTEQYEFFIDKVSRMNPNQLELSRIELSKEEYDTFSNFRGREIRKNRYEITCGDSKYFFDVFLGSLKGLFTATTDSFGTSGNNGGNLPTGSVGEITGDKFFEGQNLVKMDIEKVLAYLNEKEAS